MRAVLASCPNCASALGSNCDAIAMLPLSVLTHTSGSRRWQRLSAEAARRCAARDASRWAAWVALPTLVAVEASISQPQAARTCRRQGARPQ